MFCLVLYLMWNWSCSHDYSGNTPHGWKEQQALTKSERCRMSMEISCLFFDLCLSLQSMVLIDLYSGLKQEVSMLHLRDFKDITKSFLYYNVFGGLKGLTRMGEVWHEQAATEKVANLVVGSIYFKWLIMPTFQFNGMILPWSKLDKDSCWWWYYLSISVLCSRVLLALTLLLNGKFRVLFYIKLGFQRGKNGAMSSTTELHLN